MLDAAVNNAKLEGLLDAVLSVDAAGVFKPHPTVYALATSRFGVAADAIAFQSSNAWDAYAASPFGMKSCGATATGSAPSAGPAGPDREVRSLAELAAHVGA